MNLNINALDESKKYDFVQIKNLIETGFMHDWSIKIEYAIRTQQNDVEWMEWDKTFFAIKDSSNVLDEIMACCKSHPECSMKLICEHFSPEFRFVYCIRRKSDSTIEIQPASSPMNA